MCVGFVPHDPVHPQNYAVTTGIDFALDPAGSIVAQTTVDGLPSNLDVYFELYSSAGSLIDGFYSEHDGTVSTEGLAPGTYYLAAYPPTGRALNCIIYAGAPCTRLADITNAGTPVVIADSAVHLTIELTIDHIFSSDFDH